jgi:flagella basal body P-ring formation protein FlgA
MKNLIPTVCTVLIQWSVLCGLVSGIQAQTGSQTRMPAVSENELLENTRRWLLAQSSASVPATGVEPLRMEVVVGNLDSRLRLAPCGQVQPYVPTGSRLWGKTRLGLRCLAGETKWNVFIPVTIHAWGLAWVVRRDVAAGAVMTMADGMQAEVDWADEASPVLVEPAAWVGQVATRALSTGQVLRQSTVRAAQVFQAGAQVRVLAQGSGFQISADGQALSAGVVGQMARIRMDNGRVMSGTVLDARTVQVEM